MAVSRNVWNSGLSEKHGVRARDKTVLVHGTKNNSFQTLFSVHAVHVHLRIDENQLTEAVGGVLKVAEPTKSE